MSRHRSGASDAERDTLTVQVQGGGDEPERVLILSRPRGGMVDVREFAIGGQEGGQSEYTCSADDILATVERAVRARRRVSEDLHTVRRWLNDL